MCCSMSHRLKNISFGQILIAYSMLKRLKEMNNTIRATATIRHQMINLGEDQ